MCVYDASVLEAAASRNKWRQDGGGRRHKASAHIPGGFVLLEIKLQALLDWSVVCSVLTLTEGEGSFCLQNDLRLEGDLLPHRAWLGIGR